MRKLLGVSSCLAPRGQTKKAPTGALFRSCPLGRNTHCSERFAGYAHLSCTRETHGFADILHGEPASPYRSSTPFGCIVRTSPPIHRKRSCKSSKCSLSHPDPLRVRFLPRGHSTYKNTPSGVFLYTCPLGRNRPAVTNGNASGSRISISTAGRGSPFRASTKHAPPFAS